MKHHNRYLILGAILYSMFFLQGCDLVVDIFSAGFWVGVILAVLVIGLIIWLIIKGLKRFGK